MSGLHSILQMLFTNLGVTFEQFSLITIYLLSFILIAFDVRIASMTLFFFNSILLIFLYHMGASYELALISELISIAFMSISLLISLRSKTHIT